MVGEDNAEAYARSIIEDKIDWVVVHHRVNKDFTAPVDTHIRVDGEARMTEYVEEEDEKLLEDKSVDLVTSSIRKALCVETKVVEMSVEVPDEGIDLEYMDPLSPVKKETASIVKKEISPPVKRFQHPRGTTSDCWAYDSPRQCKVFTLSGFVPRGRYFTIEVVEEERRKVIAGIKSLGGIIRGSDRWHEDITHVVTFSVADMERMTEKIMCALAAGRWVVTPRYVKRSLQEGKWVSPLNYAWNSRAVERRKEFQLNGPARGTLFWTMKAAFLMKDERTEDFCVRLVSAGGGKVITCYNSIESLINYLPSLYRMVTHVFLDNVHELAASERFRFLVRKSEERQLGIKYLYYKSLLDMIAGKDHYLSEWKIEDFFKSQTPPVEHALKRSQDSAGPSDMESASKRLKLAARYFQTEREAKAPYKAGRDDGDIREVTVGRENNRERVKESDTRQVVVFNKDHWVETVD